jgi:hypothetical protein
MSGVTASQGTFDSVWRHFLVTAGGWEVLLTSRPQDLEAGTQPRTQSSPSSK